MPRRSSRCARRTSSSRLLVEGKRSSGAISDPNGCCVRAKCLRYISEVLLQLPQREARPRVTRGRLRRQLFGAVIAPDETVRVGIDGLGGRDRVTGEQDLDAAGGAGRVVAECDGLADERGVDLIGDAVETDGAVLLDFAFLLEEEDLTQVARGQLDVGRGGGPAIDGRGAREAAVRGVVILVFDPGPEPAIERVEVRSEEHTSE